MANNNIFFTYYQSKYQRIDDSNPDTGTDWANTQIIVLENAVVGQDRQLNLGEYEIAHDRLLNYENTQINSINTTTMEIGEYDPVIYFSTNTIFGVWQTQIGDLSDTALTMAHPYPNGNWEYAFPGLYGEIENTYANTEISVYANNQISTLYTQNIVLYTANSSIRGYANTLISTYAETQLRRHAAIDSIIGYANTAIWTLEDQSIEYSYYQTDRSIASTLAGLDPTIGVAFDLNATIESTVAISTDIDWTVYVGTEGPNLVSIESTAVVYDSYLANRRFIDKESISVSTSVTELTLDMSIEASSITSTTSFENDLEALLSVGGYELIGVESGLNFGDHQLDRAFDVDTFFTQTQSFPDRVLVLYIGTDGPNLVSTESTTTFGTPVFSDFIHRSLIFKSDNITKVSSADVVEVASGLAFNPSSKNTTSATGGDYSVPAEAAGFILVTIDGRNYKMPYYNE